MRLRRGSAVRANWSAARTTSGDRLSRSRLSMTASGKRETSVVVAQTLSTALPAVMESDRRAASAEVVDEGGHLVPFDLSR